MKKYLIALTIIIGFSSLAEAQFKGLGGLTDLVGGKEKNEAPAGDINSAQDRLMTDLKDVLGDVLAAQALIATAQGNYKILYIALIFTIRVSFQKLF